MSNETYAPNRYRYQRNSHAGELPILVGILAILVALFGIFLIVVGVLLLFTGLGLLAVPAAAALSPVGGSAVSGGALTLIFGAVLAGVANGLWNLEKWALWITAIVVIVVAGWLVLNASFGVALIIAIAFLIYLVAVRKHFY